MAAQTETLHANLREAHGTRACRQLRTSGHIPAVIYRRGRDSTPIQIAAEELETLLRHHGHVLEIQVGDATETCLLKDVQWNELTMEPVHVDFLRIDMTERVSLEVPIVLKGTPKGDHAVVQQMLDSLEIECLPTAIPEAIVVPLGAMEIGDSLHVSDVTAPEGVTVLSDPETVVVTVTVAKAEAAEEPEAVEAGAHEEPEVIGREEEEEEEAEE